jgi:hypothetical protein
VDGVFFSAPQVSDGAFVEEHNALVNARNIGAPAPPALGCRLRLGRHARPALLVCWLRRLLPHRPACVAACCYCSTPCIAVQTSQPT